MDEGRPEMFAADVRLRNPAIIPFAKGSTRRMHHPDMGLAHPAQQHVSRLANV